jgi:DNA-binding transcriptional MerR regulator
MSNCQHESAADADLPWSDATGYARSPQPSEQVLSLKNVARMFGVSQLTLLYSEFRGLIRRRHRRDSSRVYGWAGYERIAFIIKCRKAGLTLAEIVTVIKASDDGASPLEFREGQETCMALVERLERRRKVLSDALAELSHMFDLLTIRLLGESKSSDER